MGRKSISHIRKPEILIHAYKVVEEEGFVGTTIAKIADRMGVNSGLLIHYFKTKENLILELVDYLLETTLESYRKLLDDRSTPRERLNTMLNAIFEPSGKNPRRGNVFWSCYALGLRNRKVWERMQKLNQRLIEYCLSEIELYEKAGFIKLQNKEEVATIVFAIFEGYGYFRSTLPDNPHLSQVAKSMKKNVLDLFGLVEEDLVVPDYSLSH